MEVFIARENIRRFQAQLDVCTDPKERATLNELLDTERLRLQVARSQLPKGD